MSLPLTVSCFSKILIGFTFLVLARPGSPGQRVVKQVYVCVCGCLLNSLYCYTNLIDTQFHSSYVCAWFQAACNPHSCHGCQCSAMLHFLLYVVKQQLTVCFKSSKPIQIGLCVLMSLRIHLHGLHLRGLHLHTQHGETWHLSTQLRSGERTGRRLLWSTTLLLLTLLSDSQASISLVMQGPCCTNLHKWGLTQSPSYDCGQQQTMNHIVDTCPWTKFGGGLHLLHKTDDDAVMWLESTATAALAKW